MWVRGPVRGPLRRTVRLLAGILLGTAGCNGTADLTAPADAGTAASTTDATRSDVGNAPTGDPTAQPLRALLVAGGCCHDYAAQTTLITDGVSARAWVQWDVVHEGDGYDHRVSIYEDPDWASGYDVIVHDECFAFTDDPAWVDRIIEPHRRGVPAVFLHCAAHSYRVDGDAWHELVGVTSDRHEDHRPLPVAIRVPDHPIVRGLAPQWDTPNGELYVIDAMQPTTTTLADAPGTETNADHPCVWTHDYRGTRVFGTTLGHHNETVASAEYLDLVTRGLLWATDSLTDQGEPAPGLEPQASP